MCSSVFLAKSVFVDTLALVRIYGTASPLVQAVRALGEIQPLGRASNLQTQAEPMILFYDDHTTDMTKDSLSKLDCRGHTIGRLSLTLFASIPAPVTSYFRPEHCENLR
jgi:hypothetical protein